MQKVAQDNRYLDNTSHIFFSYEMLHFAPYHLWRAWNANRKKTLKLTSKTNNFELA